MTYSPKKEVCHVTTPRWFDAHDAHVCLCACWGLDRHRTINRLVVGAFSHSTDSKANEKASRKLVPNPVKVKVSKFDLSSVPFKMAVPRNYFGKLKLPTAAGTLLALQTTASTLWVTFVFSAVFAPELGQCLHGPKELQGTA